MNEPLELITVDGITCRLVRAPSAIDAASQVAAVTLRGDQEIWWEVIQSDRYEQSFYVTAYPGESPGDRSALTLPRWLFTDEEVMNY